MGYVYARRGMVAVEYTVTPGQGASYASIGCLSGDLTIPRSKSPGTSELDNWCVTQEGDVQQVELGALVIEPTFTVEMDLADEAYAALNDAFNSGDDVGIKIVATDTDGNSHTLEYVGKITNHDLNFRGAAGATSQVNFTYHVNEIVNDTVTPAD